MCKLRRRKFACINCKRQWIQYKLLDGTRRCSLNPPLVDEPCPADDTEIKHCLPVKGSCGCIAPSCQVFLNQDNYFDSWVPIWSQPDLDYLYRWPSHIWPANAWNNFSKDKTTEKGTTEKGTTEKDTTENETMKKEATENETMEKIKTEKEAIENETTEKDTTENLR